jgi:minor capsid protein 2
LRLQLAHLLVAAERKTRDLVDLVGIPWDMPIPAPPEPSGPSIQALIELVSVRVYGDTPDIYQQVIREAVESTRHGFPGSSLSLSRIQAAQKALDRFAEHGITGFTDRAGRDWDLLSYVEMATRTAVSHAYDNLHNAALVRSGIDLVTVYTHSAEGSCPQCLPWLGKTLSLTGQTPGHPTMAQARATGFRHPNCRCDWYSVRRGPRRHRRCPRRRVGRDV